MWKGWDNDNKQLNMTGLINSQNNVYNPQYSKIIKESQHWKQQRSNITQKQISKFLGHV